MMLAIESVHFMLNKVDKWLQNSVKVDTCKFRLIVSQEFEGSSAQRPSDYFIKMLPINHLVIKITLFNAQLVLKNEQLTNCSEIIKFFGVIVPISRHQFGPHYDLLASVSNFNCIAAPNFGAVMGRNRFEILQVYTRFGDNWNTEEDGPSNRWGSFDDFVIAINWNSAMYTVPSELIWIY